MNMPSDSKYLTILVTLLLAMSPLAAHGQTVEIAVVDVVAVGKGYRVSQLIDRDVINEQNEEIGEIDDFVIGRDRVLFVILEVGGFLGIGEHLIALPASAIDMETVRGKVLIKNASRAQLKQQPRFNYQKDQKQGQKKQP
jgi:sporulation protein YlmC with PRC-barrel domain